MSYTNNQVTAQATTDASKAARASTKDAGRVHIGGAMIKFDRHAATPVSRDNTKDAGRVHVGGAMIRF